MPRALLAAVSWVRPDRDPASLASELRAQADRVFPQYPDLSEHRLGDWHEAVLLSCPSPDLRAAAPYAGEVYRVLRDGLRAPELAPQDFAVPWPIEERRYLEAANFSPGRDNLQPGFIVIHDMEGTYPRVLTYFLEPSTMASAHFSLRSEDGEITQQVSLSDTAWHAGNWDLNEEAIGIEHEGFADDGTHWYTGELYRASAALVRYLSDRFQIPKDRQHIIGHYEVPDPHHPGWYGGFAHHSDPCDAWRGEPTWHNVITCQWEWDRYMALVRGRAP